MPRKRKQPQATPETKPDTETTSAAESQPAAAGQPQSVSLADLLGQLNIGGALHHKNVTVFPLSWKQVAPPAYVLLQSAVAEGKALVKEVNEGGCVPTLAVTNTCERPILVPEAALAAEVQGAGQRAAGASIPELLRTGALRRLPVALPPERFPRLLAAARHRFGLRQDDPPPVAATRRSGPREWRHPQTISRSAARGVATLSGQSLERYSN